MTVHHFDLRVTVAADGSVTADLSPAGGFPETTQRVVEGRIMVNGHEAMAGIPYGCSSPNGHYVGQAVVATALDFGWVDVEAQRAANEYDEHAHDQGWEFTDSWQEMVVEAEEWLNMHTEGGMWSWSDGDFRLDAVEDCPKCGDPRYSDPDMRGDEDPCDGEHLSRWA